MLDPGNSQYTDPFQAAKSQVDNFHAENFDSCKCLLDKHLKDKNAEIFSQALASLPASECINLNQNSEFKNEIKSCLIRLTRLRGGSSATSAEAKILNAYKIAQVCLEKGVLYEDAQDNEHLSTIKIVKQLFSIKKFTYAAKLLTLAITNGFEFSDQKVTADILIGNWREIRNAYDLAIYSNLAKALVDNKCIDPSNKDIARAYNQVFLTLSRSEWYSKLGENNLTSIIKISERVLLAADLVIPALLESKIKFNFTDSSQACVNLLIQNFINTARGIVCGFLSSNHESNTSLRKIYFLPEHMNIDIPESAVNDQEYYLNQAETLISVAIAVCSSCFNHAQSRQLKYELSGKTIVNLLRTFALCTTHASQDELDSLVKIIEQVGEYNNNQLQISYQDLEICIASLLDMDQVECDIAAARILKITTNKGVRYDQLILSKFAELVSSNRSVAAVFE